MDPQEEQPGREDPAEAGLEPVHRKDLGQVVAGPAWGLWEEVERQGVRRAVEPIQGQKEDPEVAGSSCHGRESHREEVPRGARREQHRKARATGQERWGTAT